MTARRILSLFALAFCLTSPAEARDRPADLDAVLGEWKNAVESRSVDAIIKLYDKKAVMISAFAQDPITTREALIKYYKKVVANPDVSVEIKHSQPRIIGSVAINSGEYTLSYTQDGEPVVIPSRFSFVYKMEKGKWLIVDHHSSRVPMPAEHGNE